LLSRPNPFNYHARENASIEQVGAEHPHLKGGDYFGTAHGQK
jgi:hypothetical protein